MKYKACCPRRCLLANCKHRKEGACSCCCLLLDWMAQLNSIIEARSLFNGTGVIYIPDENRRKEVYEKNKEKYDHYREVEAPRLLEEAEKYLKEKYLI